MGWKILATWLLATNAFGFIQMCVDKHRAQKNKWRIPERRLFLVAVLGGSIGSILGMQVFRHKTKHKSFAIGMPAILVAQVVLAGAVWYLVR